MTTDIPKKVKANTDNDLLHRTSGKSIIEIKKEEMERLGIMQESAPSDDELEYFTE